MRNIRYFFFLSVVLCSFNVFAQTTPDTIRHRLENYVRDYPQEKLYIHFDKPFYSPGDTIWFKVYLTDAAAHRPDSVSKIIYVDLFRKDDGKLIKHKVLRNQGGFAHGDFLLSDSLVSGRYEIVGFTKWMRNFSDEYLFHKIITIYRLSDMRAIGAGNNPADVADLQFFPEGGNIIAGMQNRVAFKAVNQFGQGVEIKTFVVSDKGDTAATVTSQHLGMGTFILKPDADRKYFVNVANSSGQAQFTLPAALPNGYTFIVDNVTNKDLIKITARNNYPAKDRPFLIGHQRGNVIYSVQSKAEGNSFAWSLSKADLPDNGVVQFTLFDGAGVPQCERLIFHLMDRPLKISIAANKTEYLPREKVELEIKVTDEDDQPVVGIFSLSVTDNLQVRQPPYGRDIYNYLYLTSDVELLSLGVRGAIEQPGYYFDESNPNAKVHVDILMMSQGWRRFLWQDILDKPVSALPFEIETGFSLYGNAKLPSGKAPPRPVTVTMMYTKGLDVPVLSKVETDAKGQFVFNDIDIDKDESVFLQGVKEKGGHNVTLSVDKAEIPRIHNTEPAKEAILFQNELSRIVSEQFSQMEEIESKIKQTRARLLREVTVVAHRQKEVDTRKIMYAGTNSTTVAVTPESCATATSILQLLQGRVAGLEVSYSGGQYVAQIRGRTSLVERSSTIVFLVDGMVMDQSFLGAISPCQVESIDVVTHPVTMLNAKGLISILTKGGASGSMDWTKRPPAPGTLVAHIQGYSASRQFYAPKYSLVEATSEQTDFRSTLYWDPLIKTDARGNAKVIFWNSDEHTTVRVALEGLSSEGKPGSAVINYSIK